MTAAAAAAAATTCRQNSTNENTSKKQGISTRRSTSYRPAVEERGMRRRLHDAICGGACGGAWLGVGVGVGAWAGVTPEAAAVCAGVGVCA
jgi:hypothetical protein